MSVDQRYIKNYFKRFASPDALIKEPVSSQIELIIVIPCHNEPDLLGTLDSLLKCELPDCSVEVIVVVNQPEDGRPKSEVSIQNRQTISDFLKWKESKKGQGIDFHLIEALNLPKKHAGVGLARKIGMDEALRRFTSLEKNGSIICLDADCQVSPTYLTSVYGEFHLSDSAIGEMHYEHQFELEQEEELKKGIINYELHLRYYVDGLKKAGFPNAIQTVGSCMLVKSNIYAKHGGMNKRKAGEDFYFLHKIVAHEKFTTVKGGTVYPSSRLSDRVPFGTGKAQQDWLDNEIEDYLTYDPRTFNELKTLFDSISLLFEGNRSGLSGRVASFFEKYDYWSKLELIRKNCKNLEQFKKQFFIWFDGFLCMKFMHHFRDNHYPNIPILKACEAIYPKQNSLIEYLLQARQNF